MAARVRTVAFQGIDVLGVDVQVQMAGGVPAFAIVGLPDKQVAESKERVRGALDRDRPRPAGQAHHRQPGAGRPPKEANSRKKESICLNCRILTLERRRRRRRRRWTRKAATRLTTVSTLCCRIADTLSRKFHLMARNLGRAALSFYLDYMLPPAVVLFVVPCSLPRRWLYFYVPLAALGIAAAWWHFMAHRHEGNGAAVVLAEIMLLVTERRAPSWAWPRAGRS